MQLVKSIIHGMLIHSFLIYSWPASLLKCLDTWIQNFVWSGKVNERKVVTMAWSKVCKPFLEGGLGLGSIKAISCDGLLKLSWSFIM